MERGQKAYEAWWNSPGLSHGYSPNWNGRPAADKARWAAVEAACVPAMPDDVAALVERLKRSANEAAMAGVDLPELSDAASAIKAQAAKIEAAEAKLRDVAAIARTSVGPGYSAILAVMEDNQ